MESMDSLEGINTVDDLMKIQTGKPMTTNELVEDLCNTIYQETPAIGLQVIEHIASSLSHLHQCMVDEMIDQEEEGDKIAAWAYDKAKLDQIIDALQEIKL